MMIHKKPLVSAIALVILLLSLLGHGPIVHADPPPADWPMWGYNLSNHRYNPTETTITTSNVQRLTRRWSFAFPDTMMGAGYPIVIGDTLYIGSWNGTLYALDVTSGKPRWTFSTNVTGKPAAVRAGIVVTHKLVIFGDQAGRVFALNQDNGSLAWVQQSLSNHPTAQITGSLMVYGDRLYVPMASHEENAAVDPAYPCCTFRGSLSALNIADGSIAWQFHTVDTSLPLGKSSVGTPIYGPSGVGIWSTPAIDPDAGIIYVTTGNSYSLPVAPYSDAILAVNLNDGSLRWAKQLTGGDWANTSCNGRSPMPSPNCEATPAHGNDVDFGSAPLLFTVQTTSGPRKLLAAEQKNGILHTLDALTGDIVWEKAIGTTTAFPWGIAYDGQRLYASDDTMGQDGGIYALDPATGATLWHTGSMLCIPIRHQREQDCWSGYMAADTTTPGLLWIGSMDGQVRALDTATGTILWTYNTAENLQGVNGVAGQGGSIGPSGVVVANGQVYVISGYLSWSRSMVNGNILDVFSLPELLRF